MQYTSLLTPFALFGLAAACGSSNERFVTEYEKYEPAEPSSAEVLVVDWTQAGATPVEVGQDAHLRFGGSRYGVAQLDGKMGPVQLSLSVSDAIDPVVWVVSPARRATAFVRGRGPAKVLNFQPDDPGRYYLIVRDLHYADGDVALEVRAKPAVPAGEHR